MAPYEYVNLEYSIHEILKGGVTLNEEDENTYNHYLQGIFDVVQREMKKDPLFGALFGQRQYVGSYYEKLKIGMPDEYDIDFELHVRPYIGQLELCSSEQPGFCQLKFHENTTSFPDTGNTEAKKQMKKLTDDEGFLSRNKVNKWMQSVVDKALTAYEKNYDEKIFKFNRSTSGPAVTLTVTLPKDPKVRLSLDFVPVFVFQHWPNIENLRERTPEMEVEKWYAVPKSIKSDRDFRLSFWHQEKHLLHDTNQMKPVLKLIKKLRDIQQWKGFSSYYIKTMFLWKTVANGKKYWCKGLGETFIEMLTEQKNYLLDQNALPFFWVEGNDLLAQLKPEEKQNIGRYLENMLKDIKKNLDKPGYLNKYFILPDRSQSVENTNNQYNGDDYYDDFIVNGALDEDEDNWDSPIASRTVSQDSRLLTHPPEDNFGTAVAIGVGVAAIVTVGLFGALLGASRRRQD